MITILNAELSNVSSGAFSRLSNIDHISLRSVTVHTLRSHTFKTVSNVSSVVISTCTIDLIEEEAFSNFTSVTFFTLDGLRVGTLGSRFITLYGKGQASIDNSIFGLWQQCSFCGIHATSVFVYKNTVKGTDGNVSKGISVGISLCIDGNSLPFVVARFVPTDLPAFVSIGFANNDLTTIMCGGLGTDYPNDAPIHDNVVMCDCRPNWMWKKWSMTCAVQRLTPGFVCAGPERQRLSDYFRKVFTSEITAPCDGVEPVDDCAATTTVSVCEPASDSAGTTPKDSAAAATSKVIGMSVLAAIFLNLMAL